MNDGQKVAQELQLVRVTMKFLDRAGAQGRQENNEFAACWNWLEARATELTKQLEAIQQQQEHFEQGPPGPIKGDNLPPHIDGEERAIAKQRAAQEAAAAGRAAEQRAAEQRHRRRASQGKGDETPGAAIGG